MAITPLPPFPQRSDPLNFSSKADAHVAALPTWTTETNALAVDVESDATAAALSETAASQSVTDAAAEVVLCKDEVVLCEAEVVLCQSEVVKAETAADNAESTANFKGSWSAQTGAANVPYSVLHDNVYWNLLINLADVTAKEPGVDAEWALASSGRMIFISEAILSSDALVDFTLPDGYSHYIIETYNLVKSTDANMFLRTSIDGGATFDSGASDYEFVYLSFDTNGTSYVSHSLASLIALGSGFQYHTGTIKIMNPSAVAECIVEFSNTDRRVSSPIMSVSKGYARRVASADVDAIRLYTSSGDMTSGTMRLYGVI